MLFLLFPIELIGELARATKESCFKHLFRIVGMLGGELRRCAHAIGGG